MGWYNSTVYPHQLKSHLCKPWTQNPAFCELAQGIRRQARNLRPIYIVTSGSVSLHALEAVYLELQLAEVISKIALPKNLLYWEALNTEIDQPAIEKWVCRFNRYGLNLRAQPSVKAPVSTLGMYAARRAAGEKISNMPDDAIVCWLDSDLEMTALCPTTEKELALIPSWPWLHLVWDYAQRHSANVSVATGDTIGDPPLPASSVLLTNLLDLLSNHQYKQPSNGVHGLERWEIADPAYDLSDLDSRPQVIFPLLPSKSAWQPLEYGLINALLWRGTLARPLVASLNTMFNPHRPWYTRGGLTILLDKRAAMTPVPCLRHQDTTCRRGDSLWMLKATCQKKAGHFPYPLLHRRGAFSGTTDTLIASFVERGMADLLGASAAKAAGSCVNRSERTLRPDDVRTQLDTRQKKLLNCLNQAQQLLCDNKTDLPAEAYEAISQSCALLIKAAQTLALQECAVNLCQQVNQYLEGNS